MSFIISVADLNSQAIEATLDGVVYYLILDWNDTGGYWTISIRNSAYQNLIDGISLVPNHPLTWQFLYSDMPIGDLEVITEHYRSGPIPRDGFLSGRYKLIYYTRQDLIDAGVINVI